MIISLFLDGRKSSGKASRARSQVAPNRVSGVLAGGRFEERFLVVQGFRLAWWGAEDDVDAGQVGAASVLQALVCLGTATT